MPLNRYQIRNEYSLADPDLYGVADKDDPEALLEGVAMAGLVGVLRQLGDLAEFAAEIFHDLHEEVMATAARGHGLIVRVQQLEAEFPSIERTLLSQTSHTAFLYNSGVDWHPNLPMDQNMVTRGDLPRFVMDSYEECRGPPRLFLLDKFDVAGAGACLKRYTDPSFFKTTSSTGRKLEGQREKKARKVKKRGPRWRNGDTPESFPSSHAKLHQLFLEERIESGGNDPERRVKLKKRQFIGSMFDQGDAKSYMEKFLDTCPPQQKIVHEICVDPLPLTWTSNNACESGLEIVEIGTVSPIKESIHTDKSSFSSPDTREIVVKPSMDDFDEGDGFSEGELDEVLHREAVEVHELANKESKSDGSIDDGCNSDEVASEIDKYMDALATIESEVETDSECKKNRLSVKSIVVNTDGSQGQPELQSLLLDSQSVGNSTTSQDERGSFSCSNSVNSLTETSPDLDEAVMAISTPYSNLDRENTYLDPHSTSEEIPGNDTKKHEMVGMAGSGQELEEACNISCLTEPNTTTLDVDIEGSLKENSLLSQDLDEVDSNSAKSNKNVTLCCNGTVDVAHEGSDRGLYWSNGEQKQPMHDNASWDSNVSSETSPWQSNIPNGLVDLPQIEPKKTNSVSSLVEEHINNSGVEDVDPKLDFCISSTEGNSGDQSSPSLGALSCSQKDFPAKEVSCTFEGEGKEPFVPLETEDQSSEIMDVTSLEHHRAEAGSRYPGNDTIVEEHSASNGGDIHEATLDKGIFVKDAVSLDVTPVRPDQPHLVETDSHLDDTETRGKDENSYLSSPNHADDSGFISGIENNSDDHHVENLEHTETGNDGSGQVDFEDDNHEVVIPRSSPSTLCFEMLQEQPLLVTQECHQNEEELVEPKREGVQSSVKLTDVLEAPSTYENSSQDVESNHLLEGKEDHVNSLRSDFSKPMIPPEKGLGLQEGEPTVNILHANEVSSQSINYATDQDAQKVDPGFNLEPPPLPPLPPMQWLGRFQNFSASPERPMGRHTFGAARPLTLPTTHNATESIAQTSSSGVFMLPLPAIDNEGEFGRTDNLSVNDSRILEESCEPSVNPLEPESVVEGHASGIYPEVMEAKVSPEIDTESERLAHNPEVTEQEAVNTLVQLVPPSTVHYDLQPTPGFVAPVDAGRTWLSTYDEISTSADANANGTLQKKLPRPRNPLIDEVVAIDKSKLRKVERVKPPVESKLGEGESLLDQLQLRKVERVKPPVDPKLEERESLLEHMQLRKVEERVKPPLEHKPEEREFLVEQPQLRKVGERVKPQVESKIEEREAMLEQLQLRKVGERVKPEVELKPEESESPRVQLRKVSERAQPLVGSKTEERDSMLEQIRNKSFSLKPAIAARPNIQGPRTNLQVAAILEKASTIRQAMVGSDEEDDMDSWSDC